MLIVRGCEQAMSKIFFRRESGQSLIEVIFAVVVFVIFSSGAVLVVLQGLDLNRLGLERTVATQYATEGLEAARSVRNQNFASLANSSGTGVIRSGGAWLFSGSNNQFGPSNKYTRTITISDVQRDGSGNIVASGGTVDPETKKVTSSVAWNFTPTRNDSVSLSTYLTDWKTRGTTTYTCNPYAVSQGYASGVCRQNAAQCNNNGEVHLAGGDTYCAPNGAQDTCCALPGPTPTP